MNDPIQDELEEAGRRLAEEWPHSRRSEQAVVPFMVILFSALSPEAQAEFFALITFKSGAIQ
jgi:hypothetical protein